MDTYRVIIRARFDGLTDAQRETLREQADACEIGFREGGSLAYDRSVSWFTFRFQTEAEDDTEAQLAALDALAYPFNKETIGVTNMTEISSRALRRRG
ncbi:DUF6204 family protein [Nonomuraea sp. NPDC003804]|uniref:DUF6204 family protein n=1 Tax=Nonomuraea sp. NPDC003804 TaxID=3154547 RepID=UPI0033A95CBB